MSNFTSTLIGFYQYTNGHLFDDIIVPEGINKTILINTILENAGEFQPLWTDVNFYKGAINNFFLKWNRTFYKWIKAIDFEYEPLYNYDRYEEIKETHNNKVVADTDTKNNKSAYNSNSYQPYDNVTSGSDTSDKGDFTHDAHMYGNIGVTTSQQMLKDELNVAEWNLYNHISDLFISEMCVAVY